MVGAFSIGDWIGGRFQVFDVHEGLMSLVYVVNDLWVAQGRKSLHSRHYAANCWPVVSESVGSPPNAESGFSLGTPEYRQGTFC